MKAMCWDDELSKWIYKLFPYNKEENKISNSSIDTIIDVSHV